MIATTYQLHVTLLHIDPPIWRRLRVPGELSLAELHRVLQISMGWTESHLHQFELGNGVGPAKIERAKFFGATEQAIGK